MTDDLSDEIIAALLGGRKIEAIKLLRKERGMDLKAAKEAVEAWLKSHTDNAGEDAGIFGYTPQTRVWKSFADTVITLAIVAALVWALGNIITVIAGLIVLSHRDGYTKTTFTVTGLIYEKHRESGLLWGLEGTLPDGKARLYAPDLADGRALGYQGLSKRFPSDTRLEVWYNPAVTGELFQGRTLRIIPYTPDLAASEIRLINWWINFCLLPLIVILFLAARLKKKIHEK